MADRRLRGGAGGEPEQRPRVVEDGGRRDRIELVAVHGVAAELAAAREDRGDVARVVVLPALRGEATVDGDGRLLVLEVVVDDARADVRDEAVRLRRLVVEAERRARATAEGDDALRRAVGAAERVVVHGRDEREARRELDRDGRLRLREEQREARADRRREDRERIRRGVDAVPCGLDEERRRRDLAVRAEALEREAPPVVDRLPVEAAVAQVRERRVVRIARVDRPAVDEALVREALVPVAVVDDARRVEDGEAVLPARPRHVELHRRIDLGLRRADVTAAADTLFHPQGNAWLGGDVHRRYERQHKKSHVYRERGAGR